MENSAYESLMIGVYILIFITATSITIYLYTTIYKYSDQAYEYSNKVSEESVIVNAPAYKYNVLLGSDLIAYKNNYIENKKYGQVSTGEYIFEILDESKKVVTSIDIAGYYYLKYNSKVISEGIEKEKIQLIKISKIQANEML